MSMLSHVSHTTQSQDGIRVVIAGVEKSGKTTFACSAPRALLIPLETGYAAMSVSKMPMLNTYNDVMALLTEISQACIARQFQYQTLIFDSGTALERLIHDAVLASDPAFAKGNKKALTMASALGGYGKGFQYANELFSNFLKACDYLAIQHKINIVITCHVFAGKIVDPAYGEYDSWDLLLHTPKDGKSYGKREMITQWADVVGFLHEPIFVNKTDEMSRAISANKGHVLGITRTPSYVAGNRFGVTVEIPIPKEKGWNNLAHAIYNVCKLDYFNRD